MLLKLMQHFSEEINQNYDIKRQDKSSQILIEMTVLEIIIFHCFICNKFRYLAKTWKKKPFLGGLNFAI